MLFEGFVIFVMATHELDQILADNWDGLDDSLQQTISDEFDCDPLIPKDCIDAAKGEAENVRNVTYYICALAILLQLVMVIICGTYMYGLRKKKKKVKVLLHLETPGSPSTASPGLQRIETKDVFKVHFDHREDQRNIQRKRVSSVAFDV